MSSTKMIIPFCVMFLRLRHEKNVFCGINFCDTDILWKKCRFFYFAIPMFNKYFSTKSKKEDTIYMRIICLSYWDFVKIFTPYRRLCGVMNFSVYWKDDYTSIVLFSFLTYEVSYSKNTNFFWRNAELIFVIDLSKTVF